MQDSSEPPTVPPQLVKCLELIQGQTGRIKITVEGVFDERTDRQNRIFHAKVNEIAGTLMKNRELVKACIKLYACGKGYPFSIEDGIAKPKPSSEANIGEMKILIDSAYEWAYDHGVYIQ